MAKKNVQKTHYNPEMLHSVPVKGGKTVITPSYSDGNAGPLAGTPKKSNK